MIINNKSGKIVLDKGTKLSIFNNHITYNEPSYIQGILRSINFDTRDHLHNLNNPIIYATKWYSKDNDDYKFIFKEAIRGIEILMNTYDKFSIIYYTLEHYKKHLQDYIETDEESNILEENNNTQIINELKKIWNQSEIDIIIQIVKYLSTLSEKKEIEIYSNIIEQILKLKEEYLFNYIVNVSSTY